MRLAALTGKKHLFFAITGMIWLGSTLTVEAAPDVAMTLAGSQPATLSAPQMTAMDKTATQGVISADKKTLTFRQKAVRLVVHSGPENDMLSYRIDGLRNPTLVVPSGATIKAMFINTDGDMTHNLRFTMQKPPLKSTTKSIGTTNLSHKTETTYHAEDLTLRVPTAGTYTYFCTVPGHAPGGMYGTLIIR